MTYGCPSKYLEFNKDETKLTCDKQNIARVWEDNINLLVQDQTYNYGCLNTECCSQTETLITGRFSVVIVACTVIAIYLFIFIINQQYMLKVIRRFNIRFLNHNGD